MGPGKRWEGLEERGGRGWDARSGCFETELTNIDLDIC